MIGKLSDIFTCPCPSPPPHVSGLEEGQPCTPSVRSWSPAQREQSRYYSPVVRYVSSNLTGGYLRDLCKALISVSPNSELRPENTASQINEPQMPGEILWLRHTTETMDVVRGG